MLERVATRRQPFVLLKRLAPDERECVTGTETAINLLPAGVPPATRRQDPVSGRDLPVVFTTFPFTPRSWPVVPRATNDYSQVPRRGLADCIPFLAGCSRTTNDYSQVPRRCLAGCIPLIIIGSAAYIYVWGYSCSYISLRPTLEESTSSTSPRTILQVLQ